MLDSPNRVERDQALCHVEFCRQSLKQRVLEVREPGGTGQRTWEVLTVTLPKCILLWAVSKMQLFLGERHRQPIISPLRSGGRVPAELAVRRAASRRRERACRSRFRIGGRPGGRTSRCRR